ncbi:hypothetical protein ALC57_15464 [Trachymyrmex cornetzi]|uniref:CCHC-type domain-containing protein n=1 Tax=Trachymyrmex cornetzi TaxID=471704 RepID=A0A151IX00_9HYME|nr:hypothetical protein ALC57_15464 [Trachymyrmex cornetzi]
MFESLVACNVSLSKVQKFHYLKTSVTGEAAGLINNLKISEANYDSTWQLLIDEYDDLQTLVHTHLHAFASLPVMKTENVNDLRKLRDTISSSLAALKNLDRPVNEWDDLLVYLIAQKFRPRTRSEWNLKRTEFAKLPSYKDINDFLSLRIRGLSDLSDSQNPKDTRRYKDDKPRSSVNNVTANKCVSCSGNHSVSKCKEFLDKTVEQRGDFAHQSRLCLNCLRSGHFLQQCPSKSQCSHCSRSHHSLLHFSNNVKADATANFSKIRAEAQPFTPTASNAPVAASSNHVANTRTGPAADTVPSNVLLATAWVDVHTTEGRSFKVSALLDQGSTFSFVSQSLCQTLRTKRQRSNLQVTCFGEKFTDVARSRVVLTLKPCSSAEPGFPLHAYVFQNITSYAASRTQPAMERKLRRHVELSAQYDFLAEYLALGHMSAIESPSDTALTPVYIPHHSVLRETSSTTKLRVVFNASCKTTNGTSLNDHLLIGPKLQ